MSTIFYNGISIDVLRTVACRRRVVLDGPTYLWTEWYVHVRGILNPQATSYVGFLGAVVAAPGGTAAFTDAAIRHQLMQPRKKLVYTAAGPVAGPGALPNLAVDGLGGAGGSLVILDCPPTAAAPGQDVPPNFTGSPVNDLYFTDAQNGPFPTIYNVVRIDGLKTFHVEFAVMARVNECFDYYSSPAVLLSHRWTQTHDVDRDGFTARGVRGHAVFRSDVLLNMKARPDDFRAALLHPIGRNCERQNVRVIAHEDGCRLDYSFTDQEVSHNVLPTHVSRIEAFADVNRYQPGSAGVAGSILRAFGSRSATPLLGVLPALSVTVVVRVWGTRRASRKLLRNVASNVIVKKLPSPFNALLPNSNVPVWALDSQIVYDLVGRYVECRVTMTAGPQTTVTLGGTLEDETDRVFPDLIKDDIDGVALTDDRPGRMAVQGNTSRGTWLQACVAQALQGTCANPAAPADSGYKSRDVPAPSATPLPSL